MIYAFTSAAANYVPKLRLLCRSIRKFHPEFRIVIALADRTPSWLATIEDEPFDEIIPVESLPIPQVKGWIFRHSLVELATGIKAFVMQELMARPDCEAVIYFDPDIVLFSRLDDMLADLRQANLVLTPHQTVPERDYEAVVDNEICSLKHGIYNLGFIGARNTDESQRFARWWSDRLYHFCRADIPAGLFTDQRWIDLAPAFFEGVKILKSPRFNVAPWNLTTRTVKGSIKRGLTVNGEPLGFYHFTGFDSGAHAIMAEKNGRGNSTIAEMIRWYIKETRDLKEAQSKTTWVFGRYSDDEPVLAFHRHIYRERRDLQEAYPDPFDSTGYPAWLAGQGPLEYPERFGSAPKQAEIAQAAGMSRKAGLRTLMFRALTQSSFRRLYLQRCRTMFRNGGMRSVLAELRRPL